MANITWTSAQSGNWNTASNWSDGVVAGADDDVVINMPGTYVITVPDVTVQGVTLGNSTGELFVATALTVSGATTITAGTLDVGTQAFVSLNQFSNSGTIIDDGVLTLNTGDGHSLERIGGTGDVVLDVTISNVGGTLDLSSLGSLGDVGWAGTIDGGTMLYTTGEVAGGSSLVLDNVTIGGELDAGAGKVFVNGGINLTGPDGTGPGTMFVGGRYFSRFAGNVLLNGNQTLDNATLSITSGDLDASGTLTLGSELTVVAVGILDTDGFDISGAGMVINHGTIEAQPAESINHFDATTFENSGLILGNGSALEITTNSRQFINDTNGLIEISGGDLSVLGSVLTNAGLIETGGTAPTIEFQQGTVDNVASGIIESADGAITFGATDNLINDGTIDSNGGSVVIDPIVGGTGSIELQGNGLVEIQSASTSSQTVDFVGAGTLVLDQPAVVPSTIDGLSLDDTIVLGASATAVSYTSGDLKMQLGNGQTFDLAITGSHVLADFSVNAGSSDTTVNVACFAAGTRIATPRGGIPVEDLREGDIVLTTFEQQQPIRWIGYRSLDCRRHPTPAQVWPVRIQADAMGVAPERDLLLSPDHAVFTACVLVPVKNLINGTAIAQIPTDFVTYYHLELPRHDLLRAEGVAVESYLDTGDRGTFVNAGRVVDLHPSLTLSERCEATWEAAACAPIRLSPTPDGHIETDLSRLIDATWYGASNPDVLAAGVDPIRHYTQWGRREGRQPCDETDLLRALGLIDAGTAVFTMADVIDAGLDLVHHFCDFGWRERRRPNPYFDSDWYLRQNDIPVGMNPLLHYVLFGEPRGLRPSRRFDPAWYRKHYRLNTNTSPLAHYLKNRRTQTCSPLPSFDVGAYVQANHDRLRRHRDPYMHFLATAVPAEPAIRIAA